MMKANSRRKTNAACLAWQLAATLLMALMLATSARALSINVVGADGLAVGDFRWLLQEDATKASAPGQPAGATNLSLNFHTSYMPVLKEGNSAAPVVATDPTKRYFVSVLPASGYQMGGAPVGPGQASVTITVNKLPIPTAQISIFVFEDNQPINGAPNLPQEVGLGGFSIILSEAGGTYGQSGGAVTQDGFGNPLGTTYQQNADGSFVFNPDGSPVVLALGNGFIMTGPDGVARIKNLFPAKYTITVSPPPNSDWHQTSTIEGTKGIDAWVKANEPPYFQEFGPPGHHVFMGFVRTVSNPTVLNGSATIRGRAVNIHNSRPPDYAFYNGAVFPQCWVGLNEVPAAGGRGVFTKACNADSTFAIPNVPPGQYQLVIWDENLDMIIASSTVTVPAGVNVVNLQEVPVFNWFGRFESRVFFDANENGFRDPEETSLMPGQNINLRFRDGSIYQSFPTNPQGVAVFNEVFPFFNWLVAEVDFARFKATGATIVVDAGGPVSPHDGWINPSFDRLNPQLQPDNANKPYRTETGPVLLQGMQLFLGQTNVIEWGKSNYADGQNGGITGVVRYATTRAEDDPRYAAPENWEPGIPRVQVNLYRDCNGDGIIDVPDTTPGSAACQSLGSAAAPPKLADVDNYPFGWAYGGTQGPEDVKRNSDPGFSTGHAYQFTTTDSWDDNLPTDCVGPPFVSNGYATDCFDGLRNFNQVRPAVFDGGYAFGSPLGDPDLPAGRYIVEAIAPPGYKHQGNGDKNVDFGETVTPGPLVLPPVCVGDLADVPQYLNLFPAQMVPNPNYTAPGQKWAQCDRKAVDVAQAKNAAADFYLFTEVPVAATLTGFILDDTANEFDPNAPTFGERHAPPWIPVSIQDWTGREISRVYSDQWGLYNAMVPSTYTINPPFPSGVMPNMITTCINSPGPVTDTRPWSPTYGQQIIDPYFQRQYSQFCYTFQYMPGKTTYLDTPVIPVAAFAGPGQFPLDCEFEDGTPMIYSVTGRAAGPGIGGATLNGPWVPTPGTGGAATEPRLGIVSAGNVEVNNPSFGLPGEPRTILRDYGFGATQGTGTVTLGGVPLPVVSWTNDLIYVRVPPTASTGQLTVRRGNGNTTIVGLTVTVGGPMPKLVAPGSSIQQAIDAAQPEDLILVAPGTYNELVVMNKKVKLQGWGAPSATINAAKFPAEKLHNWRLKVNQLLQAGTFDLVPGQETGFDAPNNEPTLFTADEGPGILVVAKALGPTRFTNSENARIDGLTVTGADHGGGIFVSGYARFLEISNNRVIGNYGTWGGGIRVGHPLLRAPNTNPAEDAVRGGYSDSQNDNVFIHHNHVTQNGASDASAAGAGIALCNGSDNYRVTRNYVCGNFSLGNGGGIGHLGLSNNGTIARNTVIYNQSFNQGQGVSGGGIFIGGQPSLILGGISPGSGSVDVTANLIQGNQAGAGDGGGLRAQMVNGLDVSRTRNNPSSWYSLTVLNNIIANNMAGLAGGGISLQDTAMATIGNNTIAHNDSTGTAGDAFAPGSPNQSTPSPAGIVSRAHSTQLYTTIGNASGQKKEFSDPLLVNNIVWRNRAFYWTVDLNTTPNYHLVPDLAAGQAPVFSDLGVLGTSLQAPFPLYVGAGLHQMTPQFSILTDTTGHPVSNLSSDPLFIARYFNGDRGQSIQMPEFTTTMTTAPAFDEGGNFIDVRFGPLTLWKRPCPATGSCLFGDYHVRLASPAMGAGAAVIATDGWIAPATDFDGQARPLPIGTQPDIGADERNQ